MDYSKALNAGLGLVKEHKPLVKKDEVRQPLYNISTAVKEAVKVVFDITSYTPNAYLKEALLKFPGSVLYINPENGAVSFTFGKVSS